MNIENRLSHQVPENEDIAFIVGSSVRTARHGKSNLAGSARVPVTRNAEPTALIIVGI